MKKFVSRILTVALVGLLAMPAFAELPSATTEAARTAPAKVNAKQGKPEFQLRTRKAKTAANGLREAQTSATKIKTTPPQKVKANAAGDYPTIYGSVSYSDAWTTSAAYGLYEVPTTAGGKFDMLFQTSFDANYGGAVKDGVYYMITYFDLMGFLQFFTVYGYDMETGEEVYSATVDVDWLCFGGLALNPADNQLYGINVNANQTGLELSKFDFSNPTPKKTKIASLQGDYVAFAIDSEGQFYGVQANDAGEGVLCKINSTTGDASMIGATGEYPYYATGACIDPKTNRMFWALSTYDDLGYLTEINLATGETTLVCNFANNEEVGGLFVPAPAAEDGAPDYCSDVKANFTEDSLNGTVTFTAPSTLFDGTALTGDLTVNLLINDEAQTPVTVAAGAAGSFTVNLQEAGLYTFIVYASNEVGDGPQTVIKEKWVGADTPAATTATAAYADGKMQITWLAVDAGLNGGYVNADDITYTVKDSQGNVLIQDTKDTSYSYTLAEPEDLTLYYYDVYVVADDLTSAPARTNVVALGSVTPPYVDDFAATGLNGWTVIDGNNDNITWTALENGSVMIEYNDRVAMDDWLITPPIKLEAGKHYNVAFEAKVEQTSYPEKFEVKWGDSNTAAAMTNTLIEATTITSTSYQTYAAMIAPQTSGIYYIGFHGISPADRYNLYLNDIQIEAGISGGVPGLATNLTATANQEGTAWSATIAFNAPSLNLDDQALESLTKVELYRGETLVNTFDSPAPGAALTYTDNSAPNGLNTYTVVGYNAEGEGLRATVSVFVGFDRPEAPEVVNISTTSAVGEVKVTWTPVTKDVNGTALAAGDVTYTVCEYDNGWKPIVKNLTTLEYTFQAVEPDDQDFVQVSVFAETAAGVGTGTSSEMIPAGKPYDEIYETFFDADLHFIWGYNMIGDASVDIMDDQKLSVSEGQYITSVTKDGGYLGIYAGIIGDGVNFFSGLVSTEDMENPVFSFYTYNIKGNNPDLNEIAVSAKEAGASEWTTLMQPTAVNTLCNGKEGWELVTVSLDQFADKVIQVRITTSVQVYTYTLIDDIRVGSMEGDGVMVPVEMGAEEVEYFNLQGIKVANPDKGIYIKRQGTKSTKVIM